MDIWTGEGIATFTCSERSRIRISKGAAESSTGVKRTSLREETTEGVFLLHDLVLWQWPDRSSLRSTGLVCHVKLSTCMLVSPPGVLHILHSPNHCIQTALLRLHIPLRDERLCYQIARFGADVILSSYGNSTRCVVILVVSRRLLRSIS